MKSVLRIIAAIAREAVEKPQDQLYEDTPSYRPGLEMAPVRVRTQLPPGLNRNPKIR